MTENQTKSAFADSDLAIWWISDKDRSELPFIHVPHYLYDEIVNSLGRGARGRLWAASQFGKVNVSAAFDQGDEVEYRSHAAGFVVTRKDVADYALDDLGIGVVTGMDCKALEKTND